MSNKKKYDLEQVKIDLPAEAPKPERTVDGIQNEYAGICTRAGHLQYQIFTLNKDLDLLNAQMRELNFEAAKLKSQETQS